MVNKKYTDLPPRNHPDYLRLWRATKENKSKRQDYHSQYYNTNKERISQYDLIRRTNDPKRHRENAWKRSGITDFTYEMYLDLVGFQNNKCKICNIFMKSPHVDHDHKTGKVRGLLCNRCNKAIGFFGDDVENIKRALTYLLPVPFKE